MTTKVGVNVERQDFSSKIKYEVQHSAPVNPVLDFAKYNREKEKWVKQVKANEWTPMCVLNDVIIMQIKDKHGIDVYNMKGNDGKALAYIIETEYPNLKSTQKRIHRRGSKGQLGKTYGSKLR